jgi:hypothetical protein
VTLLEARGSIGKRVLYEPVAGFGERGVITSVGIEFVFVEYDRAKGTSAATLPSELTLLHDPIEG